MQGFFIRTKSLHYIKTIKHKHYLEIENFMIFTNSRTKRVYILEWFSSQTTKFIDCKGGEQTKSSPYPSFVFVSSF